MQCLAAEKNAWRLVSGTRKYVYKKAQALSFTTDEEAAGLSVLLVPRDSGRTGGDDFLDAALAAGFLFRRPDAPVLASRTTC
jgi:hypothetical protein